MAASAASMGSCVLWLLSALAVGSMVALMLLVSPCASQVAASAVPAPLLLSAVLGAPSAGPAAAAAAPPAAAVLSPPGESGKGAGPAGAASLLLALATYTCCWSVAGSPLAGLSCLLLLLRSLLLSALAARGSSMLCSSCCGSGCDCPRLMKELMGLKLLLPGGSHCRLKVLLGEKTIRRSLYSPATAQHSNAGQPLLCCRDRTAHRVC